MLKRFLRWPFLLLFAALLLAALVPIVRAGYDIAHATGNASQITLSGSVTKGQAFQLKVQGFSPSEQIQLSWNGNGGQFLGLLNADATGTATNCAGSANCIVAPPTPAGTYTLTAIGATSRSQASTSVIVNLSTSVTPQNVGPGSTVQVIGSDFPASAKLFLYFQNPANSTVAAQTDSTGSFTQSLTLPKTYTPLTSYNIYINNTQKVVLATVPFAFAALSITPSVTKVTSGKTVTLTGKGFLAHEVIQLSAGFANFRLFPIAKVTADATGNFTKTLMVPNIFNSMKVTLHATGSTSSLLATTNITIVGASGPGFPAPGGFGFYPYFWKH